MHIQALLGALAAQEATARRSFTFIPSENVLSPLARVPLLLDVYSRYHFEHIKLFGNWFFSGALEVGAIQSECLEPTLRTLAKARFVDVRPISGLNCMTIAIAALCPSGGTMMAIPEAAGGHMSTSSVAKRLGISVEPLPMQKQAVDLERFECLVRRVRPQLIYLDQSTVLFPIDPKPLREITDRASPQTIIHFDSSHLNGLILFGACDNPLERGAHTFGGSTHKTLPGPHKAFLATSDPALAKQIDGIAYHYVSHQQVAGSIALAIALLELLDCDGRQYARQVVRNARALGAALHASGVPVAGEEDGFSACHQLWFQSSGEDPFRVAKRLYERGFRVNVLPGLPGLEGPGFRFSVAEFTRLGATEGDTVQLAGMVAGAMTGTALDVRLNGPEWLELRARLRAPRYCYTVPELRALGAPPLVLRLCEAISELWSPDQIESAPRSWVEAC